MPIDERCHLGNLEASGLDESVDMDHRRSESAPAAQVKCGALRRGRADTPHHADFVIGERVAVDANARRLRTAGLVEFGRVLGIDPQGPVDGRRGQPHDCGLPA